MKKIVIIFGTRPEAIKLMPVIKALRLSRHFDLTLINTGQHKELLDGVLELYNVEVDHELDVMVPGQTLSELTSQILVKTSQIFIQATQKFDFVIVHGDTATAVGASLAAFYNNIKLAHVEGGLRSFDLGAPWPEEGNRRIIANIADIHFAPTKIAKQNLEKENLPGKIYFTGNTVVDALNYVATSFLNAQILDKYVNRDLQLDFESKPFILITAHRRENIGNGIKNICTAISKLAEMNPDVNFIFLLHHNPKIKFVVNKILGAQRNVLLHDPLNYFGFLFALSKSVCLISDSGGVQEEAPSFGKTVIVTREVTERPEGVSVGISKLVGSNTSKIISEVTNCLIKNVNNEQKKTPNPYGDGNAAQRIRKILESEMNV